MYISFLLSGCLYLDWTPHKVKKEKKKETDIRWQLEWKEIEWSRYPVHFLGIAPFVRRPLTFSKSLTLMHYFCKTFFPNLNIFLPQPGPAAWDGGITREPEPPCVTARAFSGCLLQQSTQQGLCPEECKSQFSNEDTLQQRRLIARKSCYQSHGHIYPSRTPLIARQGMCQTLKERKWTNWHPFRALHPLWSPRQYNNLWDSAAYECSVFLATK